MWCTIVCKLFTVVSIYYYREHFLSLTLTYERYSVSSDWQQVVHYEQEDGVSQDEGHLEGGSIHILGRQQEAEEVHCDEERAGDQQVQHIQGGPAPHSDLQRAEKNKENTLSGTFLVHV